MYTEIKQCRICESVNLNTVLSLGEQYLTGVFPNVPNVSLIKGAIRSCLMFKSGYFANETIVKII